MTQAIVTWKQWISIEKMLLYDLLLGKSVVHFLFFVFLFFFFKWCVLLTNDGCGLAHLTVGGSSPGQNDMRQQAEQAMESSPVSCACPWPLRSSFSHQDSEDEAGGWVARNCFGSDDSSKYLNYGISETHQHWRSFWEFILSFFHMHTGQLVLLDRNNFNQTIQCLPALSSEDTVNTWIHDINYIPIF